MLNIYMTYYSIITYYTSCVIGHDGLFVTYLLGKTWVCYRVLSLMGLDSKSLGFHEV